MKSLTKKKAFLVPRLHEEDVYHLYYDVGSEEEDFFTAVPTASQPWD